MHERQEVPGRLLIPRGHPPVLLDPVPEPLRQVAVLVPLAVIVPRPRPVLLRRDDGLAAPGLDAVHQRLAVIALVGDDHLEGHAVQQGRGLLHVGGLTGCQHERDREAQAADPAVDLGAEAAPAAAQRFGLRAAPFLRAPAACWCARMTVESRISHSRSGSCRAANRRCQTPFWAQRSKRFQTLFQSPKRSGRSRQGAPVLPIQSTASTNRRLFLATPPCWPGRPGSRSLIRSQWASDSAWRCRIAGPPWREKRPASYHSCPASVHTT